MAESPPPARPVAAPSERRGWRTAGLVGAAFLGAVLLIAAWGKVIEPEGFAEVIRAQKIDFGAPSSALAIAAIFVEVFVGFLLLFCVRRTWVLVVATAMVALFVFLTARNFLLYRAGSPEALHDCGCFGNLIERNPQWAFFQDVMLLVPALGLAWFQRPSPDSPSPWRRTAVALGLAAGAAVFAFFAPSLPLDDLATRLKAGVRVTDVCTVRRDAKTGESKEVCLADAIPPLQEGAHVVVIADVTDAKFQDSFQAFNGYALDGRGPTLWVASFGEAAQSFALVTGAAFHVQEVPKQLLRPLYRRLPRSFLVEGGTVVRTFDGFPPLSDLAANPPP